MANNYNIMADYITQKYIERISGDDIGEIFVDDSPSHHVMVGMLAENRVDEGFNGEYIENNNTRFESVPSISVSFIVKKNPLGVLKVIPRGMLFYSVKPDYEKTVEFLIRKYSEKDVVSYESIAQLCDYYPEEKFYLPLTYKKVRIEDEMRDGVEIHLNELKESVFHLEHAIAERLSPIAERIMSEICIIKSERITFYDLLNKTRFNVVAGIKDERPYPRWGIDIYCNIKDEGDSYRFLMQMVNKTSVNDNTNIGYLPQIFNAGLSITGNSNIEFKNIELDYFKNSYKENPKVYAVTENTSAIYDETNNSIATDNIPKYYQLRLKTKDDFNKYITFENLITSPVENLMYIYEAMCLDFQRCKEEFERSFLSKGALDKYKESLDEYNSEIKRFKKGIEQIEYKEFVRKAFILMNKSFQLKLDGEHRVIKGWRLFQIVFIVSIICEMIRSEYKNDRTLEETEIEVANLLYFPTGGGKTEAFLGACVFDMFFDRLRGKNEGITAFLKYPLRLLAVQQLDRVLTIVMKANIIRENCEDISMTNPFQVGFFVGKNNTPNNISSFEPLSDRGKQVKSADLIIESDQNTLNEYYRFIDTCPYCGKKMVNVRFNSEKWKLEHICSNSTCPIDVLPLLIVDNEIYRYLPSIIVSTIDKMAMLGTTNDFKMLFGQVKRKCSLHGFSGGSKCLCSNCKNKNTLTSVNELKDPIPTLFIQDELHLVKESLGTFDAHYESFLNYYAKELVPKQYRKQIRFIGATATISMYKEHIKNLYHMSSRRFPCEYPSAKRGEDFYSFTDESDITRIIFGYAPYGRSLTDGMWESVYIMRLIVYGMLSNADENYKQICSKGFDGTIDEYREMMYDYWIELVYNNRKQDAMELANAFQNQANNFLEAKGVPKFVIEQMTSDVDFQTVRKTLFDIQSNRRKVESTNLLLATSTISHGVDEDSFNVMYFFGMPNNNAEYVQAYSRTGRKYTGIVIDIIKLMRVRDRSYLKNFVVFHQNKDELIESVPINRWAKNAVYSTLPGILAGLIMQYYSLKTNSDNLYYAVNLKKLLIDGVIDIDDVIDKMIGIYGCNEQEKMSIAYKDVIIEEVSNILTGIQNGNFAYNEYLSMSIAKYSKGKKGPMRSLRDTEEQIMIEI